MEVSEDVAMNKGIDRSEEMLLSQVLKGRTL